MKAPTHSKCLHDLIICTVISLQNASSILEFQAGQSQRRLCAVSVRMKGEGPKLGTTANFQLQEPRRSTKHSRPSAHGRTDPAIQASPASNALPPSLHATMSDRVALAASMHLHSHSAACCRRGST